MISLLGRHNKIIAWGMFFLFYSQVVIAAFSNRGAVTSNHSRYNAYLHESSLNNSFDVILDNKKNKQPEKIFKNDKSSRPTKINKTLIGGPSQPEMQAFQSVNANNMVDLFTGSFSYNIPLIDVGGYPLGLSYKSGVTMDQEASWVGLGWNINPGSITRTVRGIPDDYNGSEKITKVYNIKKKWTAGLSADFKPELFGFDIPKVSSHLGVFYNNYNGIGFDVGATFGFGKYNSSPKTTSGDAKIDTNYTSKYSFTLSMNSQQGLGAGLSLMYNQGKDDNNMKGLGLSANYNSRDGLKDLQLSGEKYKQVINASNGLSAINHVNYANISFARQSYTPTITIPFTSLNFSLTLKAGGALFGFHPLGALTGSYSEQYIRNEDKTMILNAYGYMHYQKGNRDDNALLDFNREKDIPYRSQTPHAAIPIYTYDVYSITGEGTGGMFRPYRGDVGYVRDHYIKTKSLNAGLGIDMGAGWLAHIGGNAQLAYSYVESGRWKLGNLLESKVNFHESDSTYEAVYFRNPAEKTTNSQAYYDNVGGDDLVRPTLTGSSFSPIALPQLTRLNKQQYRGSIPIRTDIIKQTRDKRTQVISYLTASEASQVGLDTVIKSYPVNVFPDTTCHINYELISRDNGEQDTSTRRSHHISEITVLNEDGRRYVYGIPVYTLGQKEVTFSVNHANGNNSTGLVSYTPGSENSVLNHEGKDNFFSSESMPGYAHSFLLTALLSPDYVDLTGDGITDDDYGQAIKFNYTRMKWNVGGTYTTAFNWRTPFDANMATYNEGLKTDNTDDKGSYIYGKKEIWYMNSIESKTMIATFVLNDTTRDDEYGANGENGGANTSYTLRRLKEINLYTKADYLKHGVNARPVKTVHFEYYSSSEGLCPGNPTAGVGSTHGKLTLKSIWFSYNGNNRGKKNPYYFAYHPNNPSYTNKAYDRWGNYKPGSNNPYSADNADYPYAVQDKPTADDNIVSWTLNQITLPSGSKIKVDYESDDYAYVQNKRAATMFKIAGLGWDSTSPRFPWLYKHPDSDFPCVFIRVSDPVSSVTDIYQKYLEGNQKLFFKINVKMPSDNLGTGFETIPFFAEYDSYGVTSDPTLIWIKLKSFGTDQCFPTVAALQFLRLNLPSKAYPGSDVSESGGPGSALQALLGMGKQFKDVVRGFSASKREEGVCQRIDTTKSYIRLNVPEYTKYGGGIRVKRIVVSDNWTNMTGQKESYYGQEYDYTTVKEIAGQKIRMSSGVASYEPNIGNEENPFYLPIEYKESVTMAPSDYLASYYPLGESYFPSAGVGYSKVTVSSINKRNFKSFNGWEESDFYTTYDYPTLTDYSNFDAASRKKATRKFNFFNNITLRRTTLSQGFKIELNDMNGKLKSQKSYAANDSLHPISYTINYYKTDSSDISNPKLSNTFPVVDSANGIINPNGTIGKDVELMMDFRQQRSLSMGMDFNFQQEIFSIFIWVVDIPAFFPKFNVEDNTYRSSVAVKVIQRYGILDSVVHYEKGSLVSTKNLVYDSETGNVLLSRTQNEFNDPIYNFNYPAHWAISGMDPAYKNIGTTLIFSLSSGKIMYPDTYKEQYLESGDELLCTSLFGFKKLWVVDANKATGAPGRNLYLIDRNGTPSTDTRVTVKIIRSGKRNSSSLSLGSVTTLKEPIYRSSPSLWQFQIDSTKGVIAASAVIYKDFWKTENSFVPGNVCDTTTIYSGTLNINPSAQGLFKYSNNFDLSAISTEGVFSTPGFITSSFWYTGYTGGTYITRALLKYNMALPANATLLTSTLHFIPHAPQDLWAGSYWLAVTKAHTLGNNSSYLSSLVDNWSSGSTKLFLDDNTSITSRVTMAASTDTCQYYNVNGVSCLNLMKEYLHDGSKGLIMRQVNETTSGTASIIQHMSFSAPSAESIATIDTTGDGGSFGCFASVSPWLEYSYSYPVITCRDTCFAVDTHIFNPYVAGVWGDWRTSTSYSFYNGRKQSDPSVTTNIRKDGEYKSFVPFWNFHTQNLAQSNYSKWVWNSETDQYTERGLETENKDPLGRHNSGLYGYSQSLPVAVAQNAKARQVAYDGFEDYDFSSTNCDSLICPPHRHFDWSAYKANFDSTEKHSGKLSLRIAHGTSDSITSTISTFSADTALQRVNAIYNTASPYNFLGIKTTQNIITPVFSPIQGDTLVFSAWVKESVECKTDSYTSNQIRIHIHTIDDNISFTLVPSGRIIEGWQRYEAIIPVPIDGVSINVSLANTATDSRDVFFDDIRISPYHSNMKSFVYNPVNLRLMAELDENNYASFYEYDDEGTLVRVKKETKRGIKTIQETRSALIKPQ